MKNIQNKRGLPPLICDTIVNDEFWRGVLKLLEVIQPICIALDIVLSDSIKFGESIGVIVAIAYAFRQSPIKEIEQFHVITWCESRLNLLIREDPNSEKVGFCLHSTAYFCHPGFRGYLLSTDLEFKVIAEDGRKMLLARRQKKGFRVTETNVTEYLKLMLDFACLQDVSWTMRFGSKELTDIDPIMYWGSYNKNPFIGLPIKTTHQWGLFKNCCWNYLACGSQLQVSKDRKVASKCLRRLVTF